MAGTIRTRDALDILFADNSTKQIKATYIRDLTASTYNWVNDGLDGNIYYTGGFVGVNEANPLADIHITAATNKSIQLGDTAGVYTNSDNFSDLDTLGTVINLTRPSDGAFSHSIFSYRDTGERYILGFTSRNDHAWATNNTEKMRLDDSGNLMLGINTTPRAQLDLSGDSICIRTAQSPASNGAGNEGEIARDATYIYSCVSTNTWGRIALTLLY